MQNYSIGQVKKNQHCGRSINEKNYKEIYCYILCEFDYDNYCWFYIGIDTGKNDARTY